MESLQSCTALGWLVERERAGADGGQRGNTHYKLKELAQVEMDTTE